MVGMTGFEPVTSGPPDGHRAFSGVRDRPSRTEIDAYRAMGVQQRAQTTVGVAVKTAVNYLLFD